MCLKVRTSFAANSEVVAGVDTVEPRNNVELQQSHHIKTNTFDH